LHGALDFIQDFALEDAIGDHAFAPLEASMRAIQGISCEVDISLTG
jgi:hypothetical protein